MVRKRPIRITASITSETNEILNRYLTVRYGLFWNTMDVKKDALASFFTVDGAQSGT